MDHVALDRSGPHDRDFDHQIVEQSRLQPRQHAHLRPAFDLKHADRVGPADHVVNRWSSSAGIVGQRQRRRPWCRSTRSKHLRIAVSIPAPGNRLSRCPSSSRSSLSHSMTVRSAIAAFSIGTSSHSGPRVMTMPPTCCDKMPRKAEQLARPDSISCRPSAIRGSSPASRATRPASSRSSPKASSVLARRSTRSSDKPERLADVAHRRARAIGDHLGRHAGPLAAVFLVEVLNHLFAALVLEIDVDVRRFVPLAADEPLEQHVDVARDRPTSRPGNSRPPSWPPSRAPGRECPALRANRTRSHTVRKYAS